MTPEQQKVLTNSWKQFSEKSNWRITRIDTGDYQCELRREKYYNPIIAKKTLEEAVKYVEDTVDLYNVRLKTLEGPVVIIDYSREI